MDDAMDTDPSPGAPAHNLQQGGSATRPQPPMLDTTSAANAPSSPALGSAPPRPYSTPRRTSQPVVALTPHGDSPKSQPIRRSSSAMSVGNSSPRLSRKSSRTSLGVQQEQTERRPTPKRSISNLVAGMRDSKTSMEAIEEPEPLTAPGIAIEHFQRELLHHHDAQCAAETVVILHDACYGHRWSRLKTTKTTLSMIVERPERLQASVLGASAAYVRLGEHHSEAKNAPHPAKTVAAAPPFKIRRTARSIDITSPFVTNVHGSSWMSELRTMCGLAGERLAAGVQELTRTSTGSADSPPLHEGDLYLAAESLDAFQGALGGVADAVDAVFDPTSPTNRAFVAVRPPGHHCSADHPSGFCWLNNVHVGIEYAAQIYGLTHAAILDFDLHHGDGSQTIAWDRNSQNNVKRVNAKPNSKLKLNPDIGYYSLHDINSYPCEMGDDEKVQAASLCIENAHGQNIWNVHLQPWKNVQEFWELYETRYRVLLDKAKTFLEQTTRRLKTENKVRPKAALFISAGFDASEWEGSGMQRHNVSVPTEFYARFTRDVVEIAQELGTACEGRVISVLEGGYSDRALCSGVLSHLSGLCASAVEPKQENSQADTSAALDQMMRGLQINGTGTHSLQYDKTWWAASNLTALENKVYPPPPTQAKKGRTGPQPTYATPTESFAYKVVDTDKFARSISGTMREAPKMSRPPTPPPPEVDWVVATHELSKLLIPTDRSTKSHTAEELGGVKMKKEKPAPAPLTSGADGTKGRQLRDRARGKAPTPSAESTHSDELVSVRSVSQSSIRRQTVHDLPSASDPPAGMHQRRASRRLSAASTLSSGTTLDPDMPPVPPLPAATKATTTAKTPAIRPSSSSNIQVKKARVPSKAMKPPPPPAGTAGATASTTVNKVPSSTARPSMSDSSAMRAPSNGDQSNDIEKLASGMKKITLKVGSREEHDRKQKEKEAAERRARALKGAETRRINAAAKKAAKEHVAPADAAAPAVLSEPLTAPVQHIEPMNVVEPAAAAAAAAAVLMTSRPSETLPVVHPDFAGSAESHQRLSMQAPATLPTPVADVVQQGNAEWAHLQPSVNVNGMEYQETNGQPMAPPPIPAQEGTALADHAPSSSPQQRFKSPSKSHLPVWSSTGVIPFATTASAPASPVKQSGLPMPSSASQRTSLPGNSKSEGQ